MQSVPYELLHISLSICIKTLGGAVVGTELGHKGYTVLPCFFYIPNREDPQAVDHLSTGHLRCHLDKIPRPHIITDKNARCESAQQVHLTCIIGLPLRPLRHNK